MKIINQIKKLLNITFALYTCLAFAVMAFNRMATGEYYGGISWYWSDIEKMFGEILIFALLTGVIITVTDIIPKIPSAVKYLIKFVLVYGAYWLWLFDGNSNASHILLMSTVYVIVFALIAVLGAVFAFIGRKLSAKNGEYKKQYSENR